MQFALPRTGIPVAPTTILLHCSIAVAAVRWRVVMRFISAQSRQVPIIEAAVSLHRLKAVRIGPAFLGRVVVQCEDEATAAIIEEAIELLLAA